MVTGLKLSKETLKKAKEHKKCAELAVENNLYNSAVSRYYYYCLLRAKAYIIEKEKCSESDFDRQGSHNYIHNTLNTIAKRESKHVYVDVSKELNLLTLKVYRVEADYKGDVCFIRDQERFKDFMKCVNEFEDAMDLL